MKYIVRIPVAVGKANGTDMPFPTNVGIEIEARSTQEALETFCKRLQAMIEEFCPSCGVLTYSAAICYDCYGNS